MRKWIARTRQAQLALVAAEAELRKAWQGHAPTADLTYTYTFSSDTGTVTSIFPRRGDTSQVGISVNIPLFASGATQAKVQETVALRDKAQSDVDAARRTVQVGVRQNFSAALSPVSLARGLETATRSLEAAFQANRRGYEVGLKVNAEVLDAQSKVFESRRDLSHARYDAWLSFLKLKSFAGQLIEADVAQLDALLVVESPLPTRGRNPPRGVPR
ncbi:TolC family protein [Roseateles sp. GG27B]